MQRLARLLSSSSATLSISTRGRSCTQSRRLSVVGSGDLDTSPRRRVRVTLSQKERRTLVESFVNKYRETNAGKFPTRSHVTSAVGGSYYVVKKIVEELKHESQMPSVGMFNNNPRDEKIKKESEALKKKSLSHADRLPNIKDIGLKICERDIELPGEVTTEIVDVIKNEESRSDTQLHRSDVSRNMASGLQEECPKEIPHLRNIEKEDEDEAEAEKKSFVWKHLKPLADGILSIWRKL